MGKLSTEMFKINMRSVKKRWVLNTLCVSIFIFVVSVSLFSFLIRGYFYKALERELYARSELMSEIFSLKTSITAREFSNFALSYIENNENSGNLQAIVCDGRDEIIIASDGPWNSKFPFFRESNEKATDIWTENTLYGEHIMTSTRGLFDSSEQYLGSIKFVVSLKKVDKIIFIYTFAFIVFMVIVVIFIMIFGSLFIKSIVDPMMEIGKIAKLIARGNFKIKIEKKYNDEIGELCDTVNYMAEELGNAEKIKNDFISSVSHEIRTPLTAIKGWAETMNVGDEIDKSVIKKGLGIIVHETERLSKIVEELLDFSRLQGGIMAVSMDKLDILAELGEAVYMFKERAISEKKTLVYNEPKMLSPILGDKDRLRQVFINIIDNALKYTSEGGGISVNVAEKNGKICVSVTDNGCGIAKIHLPRITEKFYKANYTKRGSGIGLAIVSEIVEIHGGTLEIISEEGFGTTVNIFFPVIKQLCEPELVETKEENK